MAALLRLAGWSALVLVLAALLSTLGLRTLAAFLLLATGSMCVLIWPWLAWAAVAAALPFAAAWKFGIVSLLDVALAGVFALWFLDGVRRRSLRLEMSAPVVVAVIYAGTLLLAALGAPDLQQALAEVIKWVQFAAVVAILPAMLGENPARSTRVRWVVAGILAGAAAQAALGLWQFVFRIGPEWFVVLGRFMRASGTFAQPNPFAGYLGLVLPVAIALSLHALVDLLRRPRQFGAWLWTGYTLVTTALIAAGLLASWSRGGWLAAASALLAMVVAAVLLLRNRTAAIALGVVALALAGLALAGNLSPALVPEPVATRLAEIPAYFGAAEMLRQEVNDDNFAIIERLAHWEAARRMFASSPWLGVGPGNYAAVYDDVRLPLWSEALGHAHNIYLNVLAESGVAGLAAFALLWIVALSWLVGRIVRARRVPPIDWYGIALAVGAVGVLAHLSTHNLVDNLFVQGMYVQVALWLGLVQARLVHQPTPQVGSLRPARTPETFGSANP